MDLIRSFVQAAQMANPEAAEKCPVLRKIALRMDGGESVCCRADGVKLRSVLLHLLLEVGDERVPDFQVGIERDEARGQCAVVLRGILPSAIQRMCSGSEAETAAGWTLCREIVGRQGGTLDAGSEPTGWIRLGLPLPEQEGPLASDVRVLLLDPDAGHREKAIAYLLAEGHFVRCATSPQDLMRELLADEYGVVVLGPLLAGGDPATLVGQVSATVPNVGFILVSQDPLSPISLPEGTRFRVLRYPVGREELLSAVEGVTTHAGRGA